MKLCRVNELAGKEVLARPIMTSGYRELLATGTVLKPEYITKLMQLGISEVFIEDERLSPTQVMILKEDVEDLFKEKVKSVLERHIYNDNEELKKLAETAEGIISNILSNDELVEQIYDIRERNADIYEHSVSVCSLAVLVSVKLNLDNEAIHDIGVASLFHDIGLRYLNFDYSNVNLQDLDEKEIIEYHKHPAYTFTSLEKEAWISQRSKSMVLKHHERKDGSGFPLHVRDFDEATEILQVCDAFDEMICGIGCKRSRVYEAIEFLKFSKGVYFSESIVSTLLEFTAVYPAGTVVLLSTGEMGIVVRQNKQFPERPVLRIVKDRLGKTVDSEEYCDLLTATSVCIDKVLF